MYHGLPSLPVYIWMLLASWDHIGCNPKWLYPCRISRPSRWWYLKGVITTLTLRNFVWKKNDFARFTFIKNFEIYSYVEFHGGFNGTNHLKRSSIVLALVDFFEHQKKTTNRIYFDLCFKFINPFQSNSNEELHDGYNCINHLKGSSLIMSLVDFFRIFKKIH